MMMGTEMLCTERDLPRLLEHGRASET